MVVKLTTEDIAKHWEVIKEALIAAPPLANEQEGKYHRTLACLMRGSYSCWFQFDKQETLKSCLITGFFNDELSGTKNLFIYLVYSYEKLTKHDKAASIVAMTRYAKAEKCTQIVGFSSIDYIIDLVKQVGGELHTFFTYSI